MTKLLSDKEFSKEVEMMLYRLSPYAANYYNSEKEFKDDILKLHKEQKQAHGDMVIGDDWPEHCIPYEDKCRQCANREQRNYQNFEQRLRNQTGDKL